MGRANAMTIGNTGAEELSVVHSDEDGSIDLTPNNNTPNASTRISERQNKRKQGAQNVCGSGRKKSKEHWIIDCVTEVAEKFDVMAEAVIHHNSFSLKIIVREEVEKVL